ncbi:hypothetical protein BDW02DRAFT_565664 [Decorospora gaudefroyi]|uniref:Uncharacterized protein n=1 Tax=Decorospora gaudefroyi TaxID=184978 RepID=A0A6A5KKV6_9PLEO|nr:hypothetical protein BDW02DRAFT_565664 [Decorospora gaudefroyi]
MFDRVYFPSDPLPTPYSTISTFNGYSKPLDILNVPPVEPDTIFYLSIIKPHTDSHEIHGPVKAFTHLLPKIEEIVSNSPPAIDKLDALKSIQNLWDGKREKDEEFFRDGFERFVVEGQRGRFVVLEVRREVDAEVFAALPAPVYTIVAIGPLMNPECAPRKNYRASSSSSSETASKGGRGMAAQAPAKLVGYARLTTIHGCCIERVAAQQMAKRIMAELLHDQKNVLRIETWGQGGKGGGALMAMNASATWEVRVLYEDDALKRAMEEGHREGGAMKWR